MSLEKPTAIADVATRIIAVGRHRVLLDSDLAALYGVTTSRLNQQVRRNAARFPADFVFLMPAADIHRLKLQNATSKGGRGGRRKPPLVFTEHGAIMAASVLNSPHAVAMSIYVVRAFVSLRQYLSSNARLSRKLKALERSIAAVDADTKSRFDDVHEALRALMDGPSLKRRPIGFTAQIEKESED